MYYLSWIANVILVKNTNGQWHKYMDFTDLNKAYPKDSFLLTHIYQLVDAIAGQATLSFLDAYSKYNRIWMYGFDDE